MSYARPIISALILFLCIYGLSKPLSIGETNIPPLGSFLSPFTGFWQNAEALSTPNLSLDTDQLSDNVEIHYDERGVPHIYAANLEDLIFAQGYVIARERLWQMDITTRSIEGKAAEVLGERALDQDKRARQRGLGRAAILADKSWSENEDGYKLVKKFSEGINFYIDALSPRDYPLEFKLLSYEPQKWTPYRTALFIKAMAITLNSRHQDLAATNALNYFGKERFYDLYPDRNKKQSPIIRDRSWAEPSVTFEEEVIEMLGMLFETEERQGHESFIGSNNFAVGPSKSKSGKAILANDPHLKLTLPSIWIEMHLVSPEMNAYGVSLPGMPGITLGFNEHISWGQTNVGQDVFDLYKLKWVDRDNYIYEVDGNPQEAEIVVEKFAVRNAPTSIDTVLYTQWGPVRKENGQHTDIAQRWVSLDKPSSKEIDVYLGINQAKNHEEFQEAIKYFSTPAQNFIFSSVEGDISMTVTGKFPVKADQQGRFVQDGSSTANAWKGFIPFEELPQEKNPERGYVASANQHSADNDYPYYYNGGFEDFRGRYINRQLDLMNEVTVQDLMNLQLDAYSLKAEEALPILLDHLDTEGLNSNETKVHESLSNWNYVYTSNSKAAVYFEKWWEKFYSLSLDEVQEARKEFDIPFVEAFRLIEMMEEKHDIFDQIHTDETESLADIVNMSFKESGFDTLNAENWSDVRNTTIDHLTNIPSFGYDDIDSPGHGNTPNAISRRNGPSWRMVVEMGNPIKAYGVYPGGISGNPGSPYYEHFIEDWDKGEYYELNYSRNPEELDIKNTITIKAN